MTKQELIANTASAANCTPAEAERIIDGMFTVIIEALRTQDLVELRKDFGSFVALLVTTGQVPGDITFTDRRIENTSLLVLGVKGQGIKHHCHKVG